MYSLEQNGGSEQFNNTAADAIKALLAVQITNFGPSPCFVLHICGTGSVIGI